MPINIALDGPAGAGKSTIAKSVAQKLGYIYVDTGALYRSIGYYAILKNIDLSDKNAVISILPEINIKLEYINDLQHIFLNGEDISEKIRTNEVSMAASNVSAITEVRSFLLNLQKEIAFQNNIIMDGRDIGTVILPSAQVKIFLTASAEKRAQRRYSELIEKGQNVEYNSILNEIIKRDHNDETREIAPLKQADDAILVDTSDMNLNGAVNYVNKVITGKLNEISNSKRKQKSPIKVFLYSFLRAFGWLIYHTTYNLKYVGKENIPHDGSYIFASNHRSYADPVILAIPTRIPFCFMAKEELFKKKVFAFIIKSLGAFPVIRGSGDMSVIDESVKRLNRGNNLVIFPEGTRSQDGTVGKGKTGVALIASKTGVPVVPVGICFKGKKLKFRKKIIVAFGKPIAPEELQLKSMEPRELKALKIKIMKSITDLVDDNVNKL